MCAGVVFVRAGDDPAMVLAATGLGARIDTSAVASGVQYVGNQAQVADAVIATVSGGTGRDESFAFHVPLGMCSENCVRSQGRARYADKCRLRGCS